jgi:hypothetical protein
MMRASSVVFCKLGECDCEHLIEKVLWTSQSHDLRALCSGFYLAERLSQMPMVIGEAENVLPGGSTPLPQETGSGPQSRDEGAGLVDSSRYKAKKCLKRP